MHFFSGTIDSRGRKVLQVIQSGREISAIILTDDYLCYKEPKSAYNFFLILIFNELFKFKTLVGWQH